MTQPPSLQLPLREALEQPDILIADFAKFANPQTMHLGMRALDAFSATHGRLPNPWDDTEASAVVKIAKDINERSKTKLDEIDEALLKKLSYTSQGNIFLSLLTQTNHLVQLCAHY